MIPNKFSRLSYLKDQYPDLQPFYSQSWVYSGITSYFSQIEEFDSLEFVDELLYTPVQDYRHQDIVENGIYGLVFEGDIDYWFDKDTNKKTKVICGYEVNEKRNNTEILGFDYFDIRTYLEFQNPVLFNEVNRCTLNHAEHDVVIATGRLRDHRKKFLQGLENLKPNLSIVTDDNQNIYTTDLRFEKLGYEVYLNKVGDKKFKNYTNYHSFFDTNTSRALDHLPHKKIYQTSLVNMILETTIYATNNPFLTEKTYKAIAHSRPFIILGDTNSLTKLRNQGFWTFSDFCDETYDSISDPDKRIEACTKSLIQLVDACKTYPEKIDEICKHNQNLFFSRERHFNNLANFGKLCIDVLYK
jgi:hypothetical protein